MKIHGFALLFGYVMSGVVDRAFNCQAAALEPVNLGRSTLHCTVAARHRCAVAEFGPLQSRQNKPGRRYG
jgi:hypothetical protein